MHARSLVTIWLKNLTQMRGVRTSLSRGNLVCVFSNLPTIYQNQPSDAIQSAREQLQQLLQGKGFPCDLNGEFGPETEKSVREFQKQHNLTVDGVVGCLTWAALLYPQLHRDSGAKSPAVEEVVKQLQSLLKQEGLSVRDANGQFGKDTERAVKSLQRTYGLRGDGIVGPMTWAVLQGMRHKPEKRIVPGGFYLPPFKVSQFQEIAMVSCIVVGMYFSSLSGPKPLSWPVAWVTAIGLSCLVPWLSEYLPPKQRTGSKSILTLYSPYFLAGILWKPMIDALCNLISHVR